MAGFSKHIRLEIKKITAELSNGKEGQYLCGGRKNIVPHKQLKKETYKPRIQEKQH